MQENEKIHPCLNHDKKFPENPMICWGQLCGDCPFGKDTFNKRAKIRKEKQLKALH